MAVRIRKRSPVQSKAGAQAYEHQLRTALLAPARKEAPKFAAYADEFMKTYAIANNKPSEQAAKARILKHHLLPAFGDMRLDQIKMHEIETLKAALIDKGLSRKWVNNIIACLGKLLRYAHEVELIEVVPRIKLLKVGSQQFDFFTFDEYPRLLDAVKDEPQRHALMLVGGEAGLREGEMIALKWIDLDFVAGTLSVRRSSWRGIVGSTKSGRDRRIPLTKRLLFALKGLRHARGEWVFCYENGKPLTASAINSAVRYACKRAGLREVGSHTLRHTFCSHLAMRGAAPRAVQELAGHSTLNMTLRYMHLAPSSLREAIELLNVAQS
jgi:integrase